MKVRPEIKRPDIKRPDIPRPDTKRPDTKRPDIPRPDVARPESLRPENIPYPKLRISKKCGNEADSVNSSTAANITTAANPNIEDKSSPFKSPIGRLIHKYSIGLDSLKYCHNDVDPDKSFSFSIVNNSGYVTFSGDFSDFSDISGNEERIILKDATADDDDLSLLREIAVTHGLPDFLQERKTQEKTAINEYNSYIRIRWSNGSRQSADTAGESAAELLDALKKIALRIHNKRSRKITRDVQQNVSGKIKKAIDAGMYANVVKESAIAVEKFIIRPKDISDSCVDSFDDVIYSEDLNTSSDKIKSTNANIPSTSANATHSANASDCSKSFMSSDKTAFKSPARKMIHAYSLTLKELRYLYTDEDPDKSFSFYISDNSGNITFSGYFTIPTEKGLRRINLSNSLATDKDMELLFRIAAKHGLSDILYENEKAKVKTITGGSNISISPEKAESGKTFIRICWSNGLRQSADSAGAATSDLVAALKVIALRIEDQNVFKFNRAVKNLAKKIC